MQEWARFRPLLLFHKRIRVHVAILAYLQTHKKCTEHLGKRGKSALIKRV